MPQTQGETLNKMLDWQTVLMQTAQYASFAPSQRRILESLPLTNRLEVQEILADIQEALALRQQDEALSLSGLPDIENFLMELKKNRTLLPKELNDIALFLEMDDQAAKAFDKDKSPRLFRLAQTLDPNVQLARKIRESIDAAGNIRPDASARLSSLHASLRDMQSRQAAKAREFLKRNSESLMEAVTTTIQGRTCFLVKAADKNKFGGMIHASSQSGQAFYVEPASFSALNSEVQAAQAAIAEEEARIVKQLSKQAAFQTASLRQDLDTLTVLDVHFAKAAWAYEIEGSIPRFQPGAGFVLEEARHPLLERETAVANTYVLKDACRILMITGPNMGGKTVTLKTIGLCVLLAHAGFPVPAQAARIGWYETFWLDIGDSQSIQDNLSTFSAHMTRTAALLEKADDKTFVLMDEAGSGTDPDQGAAIAQAVLETLIQRQSTVITSTHYAQMKRFGRQESRILVSSVEFDPQTLRPTYRYLPNMTGASYAYHIAAACSLSEKVLQRAKTIQAENQSQADKELAQLEKLQQEALKKQDRFAALIEDAHRIQKEAKEEKEKWEKRRENLNNQYAFELEEMLKDKEKEADAIITQLRSSSKLHEQAAQKAKLHALDDSEEETQDMPEKQLAPGDYVLVKSTGAHGEILSLKKKEATVNVNGIRVRVKVSDLKAMAKPKPAAKPVRQARVDTVARRFSLELNLIGMRVEEAMQALDKYMDDALVYHAGQVRIIHGMGTGALRNAVWQDLRSRSSVKSFRAGGPGEGGLGATVVELKQ